ncbi:hypothetical protein BH24DEI2_BH24DEI2_07640 [soil metagenome]
MPSGWAVLGDRQFIRGYCLLLADPVVADINALTGQQRLQFLSDMTVIGDALLEVTDAFRINYSLLGNSDPALHAHIYPRYMSEPETPRRGPIYLGYTSEELDSRPFDSERDKSFMLALAANIEKRL